MPATGASREGEGDDCTGRPLRVDVKEDRQCTRDPSPRGMRVPLLCLACFFSFGLLGRNGQWEWPHSFPCPSWLEFPRDVVDPYATRRSVGTVEPHTEPARNNSVDPRSLSPRLGRSRRVSDSRNPWGWLKTRTPLRTVVRVEARKVSVAVWLRIFDRVASPFEAPIDPSAHPRQRPRHERCNLTATRAKSPPSSSLARTPEPLPGFAEGVQRLPSPFDRSRPLQPSFGIRIERHSMLRNLSYRLSSFTTPKSAAGSLFNSVWPRRAPGSILAAGVNGEGPKASSRHRVVPR